MLWTAWSVTVFHAVLVAGCGAILMLYSLIAFSTDDDY
jgi:hypothetical protein